MKKHWFFKSVFLLLILGCLSIVGSNYYSSKKTYFACFPVQFSESNVPVIDVEIQGKKYPLLFDSGSCFQMALQDQVVNEISKEHYGTKKWVDMAGEEYEHPQYVLSKIELKPVWYENVVTVSLHDVSGVLIWKDPTSAPEMGSRVKPVGDLGLKLINKCNWLLDLKNSCIITTNNQKKLKKKGYDLNNFLEIPFTMKSAGICFDVKTDLGELCLLLDTGCTASLLRKEQFAQAQDPKKKIRFGMPTVTLETFSINHFEFSPWVFYFYDLSDAGSLAEVDGIIGVDFLKEYVVYLDFSKEIAYMKKVSFD